MKAVMYHYVRPAETELVRLKYLLIEDFRQQLDYFASSFGFVSRDRFLAYLQGMPLPNDEGGVVLTFDDGLADHFEWVFPELKRRGLWGLFFVSSRTLTMPALLDVHAVHYLIARFGAANMLAETATLVDLNAISEEKKSEFEKLTYGRQDNDAATVNFKRIMNYCLTDTQRHMVLQALLDGIDQDAVARRYYLAPDQVRQMHDEGMIIGSHSVSHRVLSRLDIAAQKSEIESSFACLESVRGPGVRCFSYPYGGFHTFTGDTERLLDEAGCLFAFNVEQRSITQPDIVGRPQALPRFDCNQFPYGRCRT